MIVSAMGFPALSSTIRLVWPKLFPVKIRVLGSPIVTSAIPGLPTITVAAAALMRKMRAMFTLTLMGAPSAATTGAALRSDPSDRQRARAARNLLRMAVPAVLILRMPIFHANGEQLANAGFTGLGRSGQ